MTTTTTFDRARRRSAYARLARAVARQRGPRDLLPLDEVTDRLRPFARRYIGLRPVPVRQIVGTDSRGRDFDRDFRPRRPDIRERWQLAERLDEVCPEVTDPDRFLWVWDRRRRELMPEYGCQRLGDATRWATAELARERRGVRTLLRRPAGRSAAATGARSR